MKKFLSLFVMLIVSVVAMADDYTISCVYNAFDDCYSDYACVQYENASGEWETYSPGFSPAATYGQTMRVAAWCNPEEGDPQHYIASVTLNGTELSCTSGPDEDKRYYYNFTVDGDAAIVVTFTDQAPVAAGLTVTPAAGTVECLQEFTFTYNNGEAICPSSDNRFDLTITDADGNLVATITQDMLQAGATDLDDNYNPTKVHVCLDDAITAPGTYTLTMPYSAFYVTENYDCSEETTVTYTINEEAFAVREADIEATGGLVWFTKHIMADAPDFTCNVSTVKTKSIACQATVKVNSNYFNCVTLSFSEQLAPGSYTVDFPEGAVESVDGDLLASVQIPFTIEGEGVNFTSVPANDAIVTEIQNVYLTFPDAEYADANQAILMGCVTNASGETVHNGTLTFDGNCLNNMLVWQVESGNGTKITEDGTYTITIPAGAVSLDGEATTADMVIVLTVTNAPAEQPTLQQTYPQANTTVNELPDYVTFMFDAMVSQPEACAIQNGYNDPIYFEPVDYSVIDGNTVKINITEKMKEQLGTLTSDGVTVYVQLSEDWFYDTHFTVAPEFAVDYAELTATGGKIYFNQNVDFVDYAYEVKCYVSSVKTKNIATQATLTLDDSEWNVINVEFADELEDGEYTLDIEDGMIMSTAEEPLASCKIPFTVEGAPTMLWAKQAMYANVPESWGEGYGEAYTDDEIKVGDLITVEKWSDNRLVIRNWFNSTDSYYEDYRDVEITIGTDEWGEYGSTVGGSACQGNDYGSDYDSYFYTGLSAIWGTYIYKEYVYLNSDDDKGYIYMYHQPYNNDWLGCFAYYLTWDEQEMGINEVNANANTNTSASYNLAGQRVNANSKGIVIMNGKKYLNK